MFDRGKRVVEVMQQLPPLPVASGFSEADGVVFQRFPLDEQEICTRALHAPLQLQADEAGGLRNDRLGNRERILEIRFESGLDIQECVLENHETTLRLGFERDLRFESGPTR